MSVKSASHLMNGNAHMSVYRQTADLVGVDADWWADHGPTGLMLWETK